MRKARPRRQSPFSFFVRTTSTALMVMPFALGIAQTPTHTTTASKTATKATARQAQKLYLQTEADFILHHDSAKAQKGFARVAQVDPNYAPAWFNLGVLAEADKNWPKAEGYFKRYLALDPNGPDAKRATEQIQLLAKNATGAMTPEVINSIDYDAAIHRARVFLSAGYFREAITEAGNAQQMDNSRWEAYAVVSLCMAKQNKMPEAAKFAGLAVDHAPAEKRDEIRAALTPNSLAATH
jgi:tetratricopeptide (TPR) repeat protein